MFFLYSLYTRVFYSHVVLSSEPTTGLFVAQDESAKRRAYVIFSHALYPSFYCNRIGLPLAAFIYRMVLQFIRRRVAFVDTDATECLHKR